MRIHNLGYPRIGGKRELKFALESYWQGKSSLSSLAQTAQTLRKKHWQDQQQAGVDLLPVGDFAYYDHVLTTSLYLGVVPERFRHTELVGHDLEFAIARGSEATEDGCCNHAASDMTKWFNTNYHYLVPELDQTTDFTGDCSGLISQIEEARQQGKQVKPVLVGPVTYLYLSQGEGNKVLPLLPKLLAAYQRILKQLNKAGVEWLQIDEPILAQRLNDEWQSAFTQAYQTLDKGNTKLLLTTYFGSVDHHFSLIKELNVDGLHIDTVAEKTDVKTAISCLPENWVISLGIVDGRNVWKTDLVSKYQQLLPLYKQLGDRLWLAPSCSLLHSPVSLAEEKQLPTQLKSWLAFAQEKCAELKLLKEALISQDSFAITKYSAPVLARLVSEQVNDQSVQARIACLSNTSFERSIPFSERKHSQQNWLKLPKLPTTTIGSFPQTGDIRTVRGQWRRNEIDNASYENFVKAQIAEVVEKQNEIGLDVLVHGEAERNDMVEYFGEHLDGFAFTQFAWVQSYGSRCVKPPIIYGDVSRPAPMTVKWSKYAQSLTQKPVKAMLTGPVTILSWSFVRDDIEPSTVAKQIALAIADEVHDLEAEGIHVIQIDEPAIREGMPLKSDLSQHYLDWATAAFRLSAAKADAKTQIHTHMCYSNFNEILPAIIALDADVLTVETARSNMALLNAFEHTAYPYDIGPGVYDIHSPNVPSVDAIKDLIKSAAKTVDIERLWINPDCGLKTRDWPETLAALKNMVTASSQLRIELA